MTGTYDTRGGSPLHNPMFDSDTDPSPLEDEVLGLLEDFQSLKARCDAAHEDARKAVQKAMRVLIRPGDIVQRYGNRTSASWLAGVKTVIGNDRNALYFEIVSDVRVDLHKSHSSLSEWYADAFPLNKNGKRMSGNTHRGRGNGTVRIKADICRDPCSKATGENDDLMKVIQAAALKLSAGDAP